MTFQTSAVFSSPYLKLIRRSTRIVLIFLKAFINSIFLSYSDMKVFLHSWNIIKALKKKILVSTATWAPNFALKVRCAENPQ